MPAFILYAGMQHPRLYYMYNVIFFLQVMRTPYVIMVYGVRMA